MRVLALASVLVLVAMCQVQQAQGLRWRLDDGKLVFQPRQPVPPRSRGNESKDNGQREFFYSFLDPVLASRRFTWRESETICNYNGLRLASPEDAKEHFKVALWMGTLKVDGVWTSGVRSQHDFYWGGGKPVSYNTFKGWSRTGAFGRGQPDNAGGDEHCLAILNNAFGDGITWHDVACHRRMAFVCESVPDDY